MRYWADGCDVLEGDHEADIGLVYCANSVKDAEYIAKLLQYNDNMAVQNMKLGYENDDLANEVDYLYGVLDKITKNADRPGDMFSIAAAAFDDRRSFAGQSKRAAIKLQELKSAVQRFRDDCELTDTHENHMLLRQLNAVLDKVDQ